mgnify:CR=1 FL=1
MSNRMFDFKDFYDRIAEQLPDKANRVAEIGVADGDSSVYLANKLHTLGKLDVFYFIDNFSYGGMNQLNDLWKNIYRGSELYIDSQVEIIPLSSLDASCKFNDHYLDFVFIDSSHTYSQTKAEIRLWYHKVIDGGILAGHDYYSIAEVKQAVDEVGVNVQVEQTRDGNGVWWIKKLPELSMK